MGVLQKLTWLKIHPALKKKKSDTPILVYQPAEESDPAGCPNTGLFIPPQGNERGQGGRAALWRQPAVRPSRGIYSHGDLQGVETNRSEQTVGVQLYL